MTVITSLIITKAKNGYILTVNTETYAISYVFKGLMDVFDFTMSKIENEWFWK